MAAQRIHPLLRELKTDLHLLRAECAVQSNDGNCAKFATVVSYPKVMDSSPALASFCRSLEAAFAHGLSSGPADLFAVIKALSTTGDRYLGMNALIRHEVNEIVSPSHRCKQKRRHPRTDLGRGRYFLRCCLARGWLSSLVMSLRKWDKVGEFYPVDAILLRSPNEGLMQVLPTLETTNFDLCLDNRCVCLRPGG